MHRLIVFTRFLRGALAAQAELHFRAVETVVALPGDGHQSLIADNEGKSAAGVASGCLRQPRTSIKLDAQQDGGVIAAGAHLSNVFELEDRTSIEKEGAAARTPDGSSLSRRLWVDDSELDPGAGFRRRSGPGQQEHKRNCRGA